MCVKFNGPADMPSRTPLQGRLLAARDRVHRRKSYPVTDAPCAPLRCVRSAVAHPTQWCGTGGYIIRPYGPACGPLVGAACMAARNQVPIRAGVRWFPSAVGARSAVMHPNQRCGIGRIYNPPLRTCPRSSRRGGRKNTAQWVVPLRCRDYWKYERGMASATACWPAAVKCAPSVV